MPVEPALLLSTRLSKLITPGFFRLLARPSAPLYIDCADRLERAASEVGQLPAEEALQVVQEVLESHPDVPLESEDGGDLANIRLRAGRVYNNLLEAGWIELRILSLDKRNILITPLLRPVLAMLRQIAEDDIAELATFADTLEGLCRQLTAEDAFDLDKEPFGSVRSRVGDAFDRVQHAVSQLYEVEKIISLFEQRQRTTATGAETLRIFYTDFQEGDHIVCVDVLARRGLQPKLLEARHRIRSAAADSLLKDRLAAELQAFYPSRHWSQRDAYLEGEALLDKLERALTIIRGVAETIDGRIAAFHRLSTARYRYQTEIRGRRPELVKRYMAAMDQVHAGQRFSDLPDVPDFRPRTIETAFYFGKESLASTRRRKASVNRSLEDELEEGGADAQSVIRRQNLYAITPHRAARLLAALVPEPGIAKASNEFHVSNDDDLLDLFAILSFERGYDAASSRNMKWSVACARAEHGLEPEAIPKDLHAGYEVERVTLKREK